MVLLLAHAAATMFMVGVIWFVQVVHYPLFARVGASDFAAYSWANSRMTGLFVGPPMLVEAATAVALVIGTPAGISVSLVWTGLVLLAAIWLSTALLQSPRHTELGQGFAPGSHRALVASNWLRTVLWSLRGLIVLLILAEAMGKA
jgi:hypothetical protein